MMPLPTQLSSDDEKYQVFGSVAYRTGDIIYSQEHNKSTIEYLDHIEQLFVLWPDRPIVLIRDNYSVRLAKKVKELVRKHFGRFMQVFLPTYSPTLNPIEMLWHELQAESSALSEAPDYNQRRLLTRPATSLPLTDDHKYSTGLSSGA